MTDRPILLIEDNPDDVELTLRALNKNRIANSVVVARDGVEALQILMSPGASMPAVVLLDLKLPKLSGFEVLKKIRSTPHTRLLPVVVLTSSREERDLIESYALGANSYIRKPVDFSEFVEAVQKLGMYWLLLNEIAPETKEGIDDRQPETADR